MEEFELLQTQLWLQQTSKCDMDMKQACFSKKMENNANTNLLSESAEEKKEREKNWPDAEVRFLIYLWEDNLYQINAQRRNRIIFEKMADAMAELGYERTPEEIKKKLANMRTKYK